ncbi:MAG: AbrB/MazE/SpoVT family DNA-binding domain-containing protein [Candidatus Njordarchaeota archaeon]
MAIVVLDDKGRILIPKSIRDAIGAHPGTVFVADFEDDKIVLRKIGRPSEKFAGIFKPKKKIPKDLDKFVIEAMKNWWKKKENM